MSPIPKLPSTHVPPPPVSWLTWKPYGPRPLKIATTTWPPSWATVTSEATHVPVKTTMRSTARPIAHATGSPTIGIGTGGATMPPVHQVSSDLRFCRSVAIG